MLAIANEVAEYHRLLYTHVHTLSRPPNAEAKAGGKKRGGVDLGDDLVGVMEGELDSSQVNPLSILHLPFHFPSFLFDPLRTPHLFRNDDTQTQRPEVEKTEGR